MAIQSGRQGQGLVDYDLRGLQAFQFAQQGLIRVELLDHETAAGEIQHGQPPVHTVLMDGCEQVVLPFVE